VIVARRVIVVVGRIDELLDERDAAVDAAVVGRQRDHAAAQRVEDLSQAALPRPQRRQRSVGPGLRVEGHRHADRAPAGALDDGQALQQIVHLILADLDRQQIAADPTGALEVADAVAVQNDAIEAERAVGGGIAKAPIAAAPGEGGGGQRSDEQRPADGSGHGASMRPGRRGVHCRGRIRTDWIR
jgi:hypothetical protein